MTTANTPSAAPTLRRRTGPNILVLLLRSRMAGPSLVVVAAVILCALFANVISPYDPYRQDYKAVMQPPSRAHLMGTDDIGRDVLSRIIYGSRVSASVGLVAVGIALIIGIPLGLIAAYRGSWIDDVIMRIFEDFDGPIAIGLRSGHVSHQNVTLTFGVEAELEVDKEAVLNLIEPAVTQ